MIKLYFKAFKSKEYSNISSITEKVSTQISMMFESVLLWIVSYLTKYYTRIFSSITETIFKWDMSSQYVIAQPTLPVEVYTMQDLRNE